MGNKYTNNLNVFPEVNDYHNGSDTDNISWNPEIIKGLLSESGMSCENAAKSLKIDETELEKYLSGKVPSLNIILKMSDLFDVSIDYLIGRYSKKQAHELLTNYSKSFLNLKRKNNDCYLRAGNASPICTEKEVIYQYPYNLLMEIFVDVFENENNSEWEWTKFENDPEWIIGNKQLNAIDCVLSTLTDKEEKYILYYYKNSMTLAEIGKIEGLTRERVRQVLAKAIRKLRHPTRSNKLKGALCVDDYISSMTVVETIEKELDLSEQSTGSSYTFKETRAKTSEQERLLINNIEKVGEGLFDSISRQYKRFVNAGTDQSNSSEISKAIIHSMNEIKRLKNIIDNEYIDDNAPIEILGLSEKTYNSLKQAGFDTIGDIADSTYDERSYIKNLSKDNFYEINNNMLRLGFQSNQQGEFINSSEAKQMINAFAIISDSILEMPIEGLDLSVRSFNCLKRAGINTVNDFILKSYEEIIKIRNLGKKNYDEVREKIQSLGYDLSSEEDDESYYYDKETNDSKYANETNDNEIKTPIEWLQLSQKTKNLLNSKDIYYLEDIVMKDRSISVANVYELCELMKVLLYYGFSIQFEKDIYQNNNINSIIFNVNKMNRLSDNITQINRDQIMDFGIENLQLSENSMLMLKKNNIFFIKDLMELTSDKLLEICCGDRVEFEEINSRLEALGINNNIIEKSNKPGPIVF